MQHFEISLIVSTAYAAFWNARIFPSPNCGSHSAWRCNLACEVKSILSKQLSISILAVKWNILECCHKGDFFKQYFTEVDRCSPYNRKDLKEVSSEDKSFPPKSKSLFISFRERSRHSKRWRWLIGASSHTNRRASCSSWPVESTGDILHVQVAVTGIIENLNRKCAVIPNFRSVAAIPEEAVTMATYPLWRT